MFNLPGSDQSASDALGTKAQTASATRAPPTILHSSTPLPLHPPHALTLSPSHPSRSYDSSRTHPAHPSLPNSLADFADLPKPTASHSGMLTSQPSQKPVLPPPTEGSPSVMLSFKVAASVGYDKTATAKATMIEKH